MNKMLEVLKQLQEIQAEMPASAPSSSPSGKKIVRRASSVAQTVAAGERPRRVQLQAVEAAQAPARKFDVSSWKPVVPAVQASAPEVQAVATTPPVAESAPAPTPAPRFESPYERTARHDLANPQHALGYQTVLRRWEEDLPGTHPRAVLIAGVGCEEGDVAEFALRLGMEQARHSPTLLVDAEPSRFLSNALVALDQPGLSEAFGESIPPRHFLQPTFTDGLKFLPAGASLPEPARNNVALAKLVNDLKAQAQWTIVAAADAATDFAADLARSSDAVYLLVRLGSATNLDAVRVRQHLQLAGAKLLGCIALDSGVSHA